MTRAARPDLAALLDVLLIVLLVLMVRPTLDPSMVAAQDSEVVPATPSLPSAVVQDVAQAAAERVAGHAQAAATAAAPPAEPDPAPTEPVAPQPVAPDDLRALLASVSEGLVELERRLESDGGDPRADAVMNEFLRNEVTLLQVVVAGDHVVRWRRYGGPWQPLDARITAGGGDVIPSLAAAIPALGDGATTTFLLFVPDAEEEPLYWAATALRDEIRTREDVRAYYPPPGALQP